MAARRSRGPAVPEDGPGLFDAAPLSEARAPARPEVPPAARPRAAEPAPSQRPTRAEPEVRPTFTVGALTREIQAQLAQLGRISVEGELTSLKRAASGHVYFDLKDEKAKIACIVWKSQVDRALRTAPQEGMQVVVHGRLDVYAPRGGYSLIVERVEPRGLGALLAKYEQLKRELEAAGWFARKRPLPTLPERIGIVTSRDGAALRDFLRTRTHRWPGYPVRLAHAAVQGYEAAGGIADAIARLDASGVDVIVVTRGGGSLEDLWAFNERPVAEAIWAASVPVVSAVGHESDVSLCDFVADHRAHTPTDAAQTVIPDRAAYTERLRRAAGYLDAAMEAALERRAERIARARGARVLRDAAWILDERRARLERVQTGLVAAAERGAERRVARTRELFGRLERVSPRARVQQWIARAQTAGLRLQGLAEKRLTESTSRVGLAARALEATSPLAVLGRGYSLTSRAGETGLLRSAADLAQGDELVTRLADGQVRSRVVSRADEGD